MENNVIMLPELPSWAKPRSLLRGLERVSKLGRNSNFLTCHHVYLSFSITDIRYPQQLNSLLLDWAVSDQYLGCTRPSTDASTEYAMLVSAFRSDWEHNSFQALLLMGHQPQDAWSPQSVTLASKLNGFPFGFPSYYFSYQFMDLK